MALDRPIVTEASLNESKKILDAKKAAIEQALAKIESDYKTWKAKLSPELITEYNEIRDRYKRCSKRIDEVLKECEAYRQKKVLLAAIKKNLSAQPLKLDAIPESLSRVDNKAGFFSGRNSRVKMSPQMQVRQPSSARVLASLPHESERVERLQASHQQGVLEDAKSKGLVANNFLARPVLLSPLDRVGTFVGGVPNPGEASARKLKPSVSEQLLRKGKIPCESQPSLPSQKTKRWG